MERHGCRDPEERQGGQAGSFRSTGRAELDWGLGPAGRELRNSSFLSSGGRRWRGRPGCGRGGKGRRSHSSPRHTRCGRKRNSRAQLPLAPAQRSAMAAEDVDGLAVSRPHYGCEYRGLGNPRGRQAELPVPSRVQRWEGRLGRRKHGGSSGVQAPGLLRGRGAPLRLSSRAPGEPRLPPGGRRATQELVEALRSS